MSSSIQSHVLAVSGNYAVVKLDHRQFPGVLIQGDGLFSLIQEIEEAKEAAKGNEETKDILNRMIQKLKGIEEFYEQTLQKNGIRIPY